VFKLIFLAGIFLLINNVILKLSPMRSQSKFEVMRQKAPLDLSILAYGVNTSYGGFVSPCMELDLISSIEKPESLDVMSCPTKALLRPLEATEQVSRRKYGNNIVASDLRTRHCGKRDQSSLCWRLVEPEKDVTLGTEYDVLLFSQMEMTFEPKQSFRCKHCSISPSSKFGCEELGDVMKAIESMEYHLLECCATPSWLTKRIKECKVTLHTPNNEFISSIWKRLLLHGYSRNKCSKRVKFADKLCQELIIPSRHHVSLHNEP
jgi:hypothetical protein